MVPGSRRKLVEERLAALASGFSRYVDAYDDLVPFTSQQLRLHRQTIALRREAGSAGQAIDSTDFLLSLRATLEAWGLGVRGSRLAPEGEFVTAIRSARAHIEALDGLLVDDPSLISNVGEQIFSMLGSLNVVDNQAKLVAGTKTLHHLLPDLVMPMDRVWTGRFFQLHSPEWQAQDNQRRTFLRVFGDLRAIARLTHPHQYADGLGWRTSRSKILDNALIGFCKVELSDQAIEYGTDARRGLVFTVPGFPPAKNEALSMLGSRAQPFVQGLESAPGRQGSARAVWFRSYRRPACSPGGYRQYAARSGSLGCHKLPGRHRRCPGRQVKKGKPGSSRRASAHVGVSKRSPDQAGLLPPTGIGRRLVHGTDSRAFNDA
jgi:hypothetical protein